jgi:hypothetical protein
VSILLGALDEVNLYPRTIVWIQQSRFHTIPEDGSTASFRNFVFLISKQHGGKRTSQASRLSFFVVFLYVFAIVELLHA